MSATVILPKPIDISNLKPRALKMSGPFSSKTENTYNIEAFTSVRQAVTDFTEDLLTGDYEGWDFAVYAWRSTSRLPAGDTKVTKLQLNVSPNAQKQMLHISVILLP